MSNPKLNRIGLTPREMEVAIWFCEGKSKFEIAMILGIRPKTVANHRESIYAKLGINKAVMLPRILIRKGLLEA